jgi:alkyl sulfatase BDS1-like metallo-beta-lactamase superfamily hydrolase
MPIDLLFDFVGVRIIGEKASEVDFRINFTFAEHGDEWTMWVRDGVLNARNGHVEGAQLSVSGPKPALAGVLLQPGEARELIDKAGVAVDGDLGCSTRLARSPTPSTPGSTSSPRDLVEATKAATIQRSRTLL